MNSEDYTRRVLNSIAQVDTGSIQIKNLTTVGLVPLFLAQGELAVNITDKKLWIGNELNAPVLLVNSVAVPAAIGLTTQIQFNDGGVIGAHAGLTYNKATSTMTVTNLTALTNVTGNAGTATQLLNARNVALSGEVLGNTNFNGTGNVSISTTIPTLDGGNF